MMRPEGTGSGAQSFHEIESPYFGSLRALASATDSSNFNFSSNKSVTIFRRRRFSSRSSLIRFGVPASPFLIFSSFVLVEDATTGSCSALFLHR